ncbi:unnamed protein product, partial [Ectocarpus sp. 12 AP-2014]
MTDQGALESQLAGLRAQREQLVALVGDDPHSPLIPLQEELAVAIDGIIERLSLLREQAGENNEREEEGGQQATTGASTLPPPPPTEGQEQQQQEPSFPVVVGALCLAPRVFDRRRARAVVEEVESFKGTCLVTWVHPRKHGEIVCRSWKKGRSCKFSGPDCRFSHGIEVPLSGLLPDDGGGDSSWLASLRSGSQVLACYLDRVWYEATAEGPATPAAAAGAGAAASSMLLAVRFKGFEDDGPVSVPADSSHLAPLEAACTEPEMDGVGGGNAGSSDGGEPKEEEEEEESDLEDAWAADAAAAGCGGERDGNMTAGAFFQERVLG